jgi:ribosomal protein S18 acetylase RimI-like enzyme
MEPVILIRAATVNDIVAIQQIAYTTWPVAYGAILTSEQLEYMLAKSYSKESLTEQINTGHSFLLAIEKGIPVGFAAFNLSAPQKYKLQKLYVLPTVHKNGAGKLLLDAVIERIKEKGAHILQLNVNRNNKAIGFYQKMGFGIIEQVDIPIGNGYFMNDYVMEKQL